MNLIDLSIRRPVFAWVLMFTMIVFGAICLNKLGISQMPDVDFPVLNISITYEGAAPEVIEADLIEPIEQRLLQIEGVKEMRSTANQGVASVTLEFEMSRNIDVALQEVQSALSQLVLPPNVDPPIIRKTNPDDEPILIVAIYGGNSTKDMLLWINNYLTDQLQFISGVGLVSVAGFPDPNMRVWIDPKKLKQYDLTVSDLTEALRTQHIESSAGQFVKEKQEIRVRWLGEATSPQEIGEIQISKRGGQPINTDIIIKIKDVAKVEEGLADIRRFARIDGTPAVAIQVRKQRGSNEVQVADAIRKKLEQIKPSFPEGFKSQITVDFTKATKATVFLTQEKLMVAALITILVCFAFLGSYQAALNILISLPTSIIGTFAILYFSGFTLNLFTLLALTLAISIVVDDAIMLLENIVRHYRMGKPAAVAAADGAKEVLPAAIAATLAVIAVFLPVIFMSGIIGKFFFQFGVTLCSAVLLSLLEAVTITPMRAAAFYASEPKVSNFEKRLDHIFENWGHKYQKVLQKTLQWKTTVVVVSLAIFALSLILVAKVRQEFVPLQDQDLILLTGQTKPGSSLDTTNKVALELEEIIKQQPEVASYLVSVGGGGGSAVQNPTIISMPLTLKPRDERKLNHVQVMDELRKKLKSVKGIKASMRDISARNLTSGKLNPISFNLRGPNLAVLSEKVHEIISRLESEGLAIDLDTDYRKGIPELLVTPDRKAMSLRGVSAESVSQLLQIAVGGYRQGQYTNDGKRYDIRFKIPDELISSPEDIKNLEVRNNAGNRLPLKDFVIMQSNDVSQSITRINRQRSMSVFGNLAPGKSQAAVLGRAKEIATEILPPGYSFALEGASAGFSQSFSSLFSALMIGILVAYLILAVQFDSFIHPISVLMALPFSATGALLTLWFTGTSLNLFSFIGLIVLMGIAKKNSIMLVEFTNQLRAGGIGAGGGSAEQALLQACPVRLRPILMTSIATVAAAFPLILGHGIGSETRGPMGLTIIGGTIVSTILTLFVVPALYLLLTRLEKKRG
ncbi:MAG: efflux RND transporter permease subunit [Pseudobdellovibrionaceae bacterium]